MSTIGKIRIKKVNNCSVPKLKINQDKGTWKGSDIIDVRYWVAGLLGKRRSGKTTLIYSLIKNFLTKNTIIIFYVSTFYKDSSYDQIRALLEKKKVLYHAYTEIGANSENLQAFVEEAERKVEVPKEEEKVEKPIPSCRFDDSDDSEDEDEHKPEPEYLLVFDDVSTELRNPLLLKVLKNSRHYKAKIILSTQSVTDLHPHAWAQFDVVALWKNFNREHLKQIYDRIEPQMNFSTFLELYHGITHGTFNFMFIDRNRSEVRINLNELVEIG